jgi:DNA-binding MarR family transcriptional regulator
MSKQTPESRSNNLAQLDKLLEHRSRLGVCVLLADSERIAFSSLKKLVKETDGNMGAHLRKLEDAGYVNVDKRFEKRKPVSWYQLTGKGRTALKAHLDALQALIEGLGG